MQSSLLCAVLTSKGLPGKGWGLVRSDRVTGYFHVTLNGKLYLNIIQKRFGTLRIFLVK